MHFFDESFWLAVCFFIFIYLAYRPVKKAILSNLDKKINEVKTLVYEAENLKKDAIDLLLKTQNEIKELDDKRRLILDEAQSEANKIAESRKAEMEFLLKQNKEEAINAIDRQKIQSYNKIRQDFMQLTKKLVEEYLKESNNNDLNDIEIAKNFMHGNPKD